MLSQKNIERRPVIQRGNLTIDSQCCTFLLDGNSPTISTIFWMGVVC